MSFTFAGHWGPEALLDDSGSLQKLVSYSVYQPGTTTPATTYSDETKTRTTSGLATDSHGNASFYADPGDYDLVVGAGTAVRISVAERPGETENVANKGQPLGYASLDATGKVPLGQLPAAQNSPNLTVAMSGDVTGTSDVNVLTAGLRNSITGSEQVARKGVASGYAALDASTLVPVANIPALPESRITGLVADLTAKQAATEKGAANGYAPLDSSGKVPTANLPTISGGGITYVPGGTTDDTAAVQNFLTNMPAGTDAIFAPNTVYTLTAPVRYKGGCRYMAPGHSLGNSPAIIMAKSGSNIPGSPVALFVPAGWDANNAAADAPVVFFNLLFDNNYSGNTSSIANGLILANSLSTVAHCYFKNCILANGLRLADKTKNGTTLTTVPTEPHLFSNRFEGGGGIYVQNSGGAGNVDGIAFDNKFTNINGVGMAFDKCAGWLIMGNRFYGGPYDTGGIAANKVNNTIISNNIISDFGGLVSGGAYYQAIAATVLNGQGVTISGNKVSCLEHAGTDTFQYIAVTADSGQSGAYAIITGNELHGLGTSNALGLVYQLNTGGVLHYASANNVVIGFASGKQTFITSPNAAVTTV